MQVKQASSVVIGASNRSRYEADERTEPPKIAVVGAGVAGAACAAGLLRVGFDVAMFDKSRGVGGRMATRRVEWTDVDGNSRSANLDHGCPSFKAARPRFQSVVDRAEAFGCVSRWRQQLYPRFPAPRVRQVIVPTPNMPAFCQHLLAGVPLCLGHAVTELQRVWRGWNLSLDDGRTEGPFDQVVLALPPAQAANLLTGHRADWAGALAAVPMSPCWTLMGVTDDLDWPWDAAEVERGELAWIARNDRKPGRNMASAGSVQWVAHATTAWSRAHLEDDPVSVEEVLRAAVEKLLPGGRPRHWHHSSVHRWRYATLAQAASDAVDCWWSADHGLGVCGDSFGDGSVEAAWCSGDELADAVAASLDAAPDVHSSREVELDEFAP